MMNERDQAEFDRIIKIHPSALMEHEKAFLRARSSYLTEELQRHFHAALEGEPEDENETDAEAESAANSDKPLEEMTKKELTVVANGLGLEVGVFESKASVIEKITAAHSAQ